MPSNNNFPYQAIIGSSEIWIFSSEPSEYNSVIHELEATEVGYIPDPRSSMFFFQNAKRYDADTRTQVIQNATPLNADGDYYEFNDERHGLFTVTLKHSDGTTIDSAVLNDALLPSNKGSITYSCYNWYITIDNTLEEPRVKSCGIAARFTGTYNGELVSATLASPFTTQAAIDLFNGITEIRYLTNYYGQILTLLKESNGFEITTLPPGIYGLKPWSDADKHYTSQVIPIDENYDIYDLNAGFISHWSDHDYYKDLNPYSLSAKFHSYYKEVGSDMLRQNPDGKFTNGADLNQTNLIFPENSGETFDIPFSGGKIQLKTNSSGVRRQILLYNSAGTLIDSAALNYPISGGESTIRPGSVRMDPAYSGDMSVFLCKEGSNYYLVSLRQRQTITDADGQTISYPGAMGHNYYDACYYSVIHKFNNNANELLENGSESIIDYDPEHIDESSPEASTGDNQTENYDRSSQWSAGEGAGSNEGIRHNGSDIINASDYEENVADETPRASSPPEIGENRIITPLNSGAIKAFIITDPDDLTAFMGELNTDDFGSKLTKYFSNPMDVFISLHRCICPAITPGADKYLTYGLWHSEHALPVLDQEMYDVNMGFLNVAELTNSFKDYPPFCRYYIYLPYIGMREIDGKLIAGKRIELYYHINVLTGDILADLCMLNERTQHTDNIYYWSGNTLASMPLKSTDYSTMISGLIATAISVGGAVATGNPLALLGGVTRLQGGIHPDITMLGTVTGSTTFAMPNTPYIVRIMPEESNKYPENYNRLQGRPSNIGASIGASYSASGNRYIVYSESDLAYIYNSIGATATEDELAELKRLLLEGVYV